MDMHVAASHPLLVATSICGHLEGLLGEIRITQTFTNAETVNLEAVFTFPVPLEAVLLGVSVQLDERRLEGRVMPRAEAEEHYEEAIVAGDGAIRLQNAGPGRYTINVGNLLPGQTARLEYRYGLLGVWSGEIWRLLIPTTLAPRYGSATGAGLQPHQVPEVSLSVDHRFTLDLTVSDLLATASVSSPSHALRVTAEDQQQRICLVSETAPLDRDLVLLIRSAGPRRAAQALVAPDGDGVVALVTVQPALAAIDAPRGCDLVMVADCSGSMAGVSIAQTREALAQILERLTPDDRFNLIAFGSHPRALFPKLQFVDRAILSKARTWVAGLNADLGGTEMGDALELAFQQGDGRPLEILLITDGEVWGVQRLVARARATRHRIFTVGVGAAVAEDLVRGLAEASGGAAVLLHPNETMADQIVRQFERMRSPRATLDITWPGDPAWVWPTDTRPCYDGDTLHRLAGWPRRCDGMVGLRYQLEDGRTQLEDLDLVPWPASAPADLLPRLAAARRLADLPEAQARALAVTYQLVTPMTDLLMIAARDAATRATTLPELRPVQQVLAAGWGGLGDLDDSPIRYSRKRETYSRGVRRLAVERGSFRSSVCELTAQAFSLDDGAFDDRVNALDPTAANQPALADWLDDRESRLGDPLCPLPSLDTVAKACGITEALRTTLQRMIQNGASADAVVAILLLFIVRNSPGLRIVPEAWRRLRFESTRSLTRSVRRNIRRHIDEWWNGRST